MNNRPPMSEILFGRPQPQRMKAKRDVAGLVRVVDTARYPMYLRGEAIDALAELRDPASIEALVDALGDDDPRLRTKAAEALGNLGDARAIGPLVEALGDDDPRLRTKAAEALGNLGDARAIGPLVDALGDGSRGVGHEAASALERLRWQPADDPRAVLSLLAKPEAHWAIWHFADPPIQPLIGALADPELRGQALSVMTPAALGRRAVEPLVAALGRPEPGIRSGAAHLLGRLGDQFGRRATEPLAARLGDEDEEVRRAAAFALVQFRDPRALEPLIRFVRERAEKEAINDTARQAIHALGYLGDARAIGPLVEALGDGREPIRHEAASALEHLGWQPADDYERAALAVATEDWDRAVSLGSPAIEPLVAMLGTADYGVQVEAAKVLGTLGWSPPDERRRILLAIAAGDWEQVAGQGRAAVEPLAAVVEERSQWIRWGGSVSQPATPAPWQAAHLLAALGDPRAVAAITWQLEISFERIAKLSTRLEGLVERRDSLYDPADFGVAEAEEAQHEAIGLVKRLMEDLAEFGTVGQQAFERLLRETRMAVPDFARRWSS